MCFRTVPGNLGILFRINQDGCKSTKSFLCYNHQKLHEDYNHEVLQQSILSTEYLHLKIFVTNSSMQWWIFEQTYDAVPEIEQDFQDFILTKNTFDPIIPNHISEPFAKLKICCINPVTSKI